MLCWESSVEFNLRVSTFSSFTYMFLLFINTRPVFVSYFLLAPLQKTS